MKIKATAEQLRYRLGRRASSAAQPQKNKKRALTKPGKGDRGKWKLQEQGR